jgi:hypothetical protein
MLLAMRGLASRLALSVVCVVAGAACSPTSVCKMGGPINDPTNRTLRRNIMSYGLGQFCQQMLTRNAPLKLAPDAPVIGRFYPQHCQQRTLDNGDLWVQFDGMGYAFTNLSRKVTFTNASTIQYDDDFRCADDSSIYAYFDPRAASPPSFHVLQIEQPIANLMQNWVGPFADNFGKQMVSGQLAQGITVIQGSDGTLDFDVGHLRLGQRPVHPFALHGKDRVTVESLRTQVYANERDFIGPVKVDDGGRAIYMTMQLDGQPAADVMLIPKAQGDAALQAYVSYGPAGPLPFPPMTSDVIQYGVQYQRAVPVPPGMYYVVIDNTPTAGQAAPPASSPFGAAAAAVINYSIEIGDAP